MSCALDTEYAEDTEQDYNNASMVRLERGSKSNDGRVLQFGSAISLGPSPSGLEDYRGHAPLLPLVPYFTGE